MKVLRSTLTRLFIDYEGVTVDADLRQGISDASVVAAVGVGSFCSIDGPAANELARCYLYSFEFLTGVISNKYPHIIHIIYTTLVRWYTQNCVRCTVRTVRTFL